ncbi:MAG: hypothetical protein GF347_02555 [Candidatus Moranbacteria bacterium]|nr:hypothetical protein [Candidatus Moranbacteria bacterium]
MPKHKKADNEKIFLLFYLVFIFLAGLYLFSVEALNNNYTFKKNWTVAYFENPDGNDLSFIIENYENLDMDYKYSIVEQGKVLEEDTVFVKVGEKAKVELEKKYNNAEIIIRFNEQQRILKK